MTVMQRLARYLIDRRLKTITSGHLTIEEAGTAVHYGEPDPSIEASIEVRDPRFYPAVMWGGHIGAAEAYAAGWWTTSDLTTVVRLFVRNREALDGLETGVAALLKPVRAVVHALRRNTKHGSARNIAAHYDLGNEFFELFLDETLTYSSGFFETDSATLADASRAKYDRICRKLALGPSHHVLEIGGGWGGFAIHAATKYGCRVTTITISAAQYRLATERVNALGLSDRVQILERDYRDIDGEFDRVVSIEMIEAVGHHYYQTYFRQCTRLLKPDGMAAIQSITIQPRHFQRASREVDFIKKYIFPGSCIPSIPALARSWEDTDLSLCHAEEFGLHYARTLREWHHRFDENEAALERLGYDQWFRRIWKFYFAYCEGGFAEGAIGVSQLVLAKPQAAITSGAQHQFGEQAA